MLNVRKRLTFLMSPTLVMAVVSSISLASPPAENADTQGDRLFTLKVLPVFKAKCFACHGADRDDIRGEYSLLNRETMLAGGESGERAVIPGDPARSPLYRAVLWQDSEMPPKQNDRLTPQQTGYIRDWIALGAPWPAKSVQLRIKAAERSVRKNKDGVLVSTSGGLTEDWTYRRYRPGEIWAFQPLNRSIKQTLSDQKIHPVDHFINEQIESAGLKVASQASPDTLIRRVTFDLTGIPPSPEDILQFKQRWSQEPQIAWRNLINRLLDSVHYGERQAQHWLDVTRYADTAGFSNDYERSNAWRYRDYVIRAFNSDKPFNQFIVEQIAGDELRPDDPEAHIGLGFLRMGPWGTAMIPKEEARQIYLDDLVHNVGQTFLAMPLRCCKCHDHKFDPIPTRDYYSIYAAFATTQPAEIRAAFLPSENQNGFAEKRKLVDELLAFARSELAKVDNKQEAAARRWYAERDLPYKNENDRRKDPENTKPPRHIGLTPAEQGIKKVRTQDVWIWERRLERFEPLIQGVYNGAPASFVNGRKLRKPAKAKPNWHPVTRILGGGSLESPLSVVQPGILSAAGLNSTHSPDTAPARPTEISGRRLQLARWIADDNNPLTARVIVNRIWQSHFGTGLVKTANNFGAKGGRPTHPELLEWLTADFLEHGWKIKRLHRLILMSDTYQRSSVPTDLRQQATVDPNNQLLASFPPRRLSAEELRDAILATTGELNRETGGLPVMPEINMEVALQPRMIQFSIAPAHQPSRTPSERNRRTIYTYRVRGQADPFLEIMNRPSPNESCEIRDSAAVTTQSFTLLNSQVMTDRSLAFALRVRREHPHDLDQWIRRAVELAYLRLPTPNEHRSLREYLVEMQGYHREHTPVPVPYPVEVTRSLVEEFTGRPFEFTEKLNVFEDYVPDAKSWTVDSDTRALADVCLLLLNSNEFIYLY